MANERTLMMTPHDASTLQQVVRAVRNIRGSGGVQVHYAPGGGITIGLRAAKTHKQPAPFPYGTRLIVNTEKEDYLACQDPISGKALNVLKPSHLRGHIRKRQVGDDTHVIYPSYQRNTTIVNGEPKESGDPVEVFVASIRGTDSNVDDNGNQLKLIDLNYPTNRQWVFECP